jgi:glycosyltransferase involved in cell wall biosynthesis
MTFSIITITYNAASTVEATIRSVLSQTYAGIEYIIIDGASTDGTCDVIRRYADERIKYTSAPDKGIYDAMNKGLRLATGDYVWFINAGDRLYADSTVAELAALMLRNPQPDIVYGETAIIDLAGNFVGMRRLKAPSRLTRNSFKNGMMVCHQSFVVRRAIAPFFNTAYRFSSDFEWCIRCMDVANNGILNSELILSRYLNEGTTMRNMKASLKERFRIMCKYYGVLPTVLRHVSFAARFATAKITGKEIA